MCSHWSVPHDFTTRRALQPGAPDECVTNITRRSALALLAGVLATAADGAGVRADALPTEVAGVTIPNTALTRSAARLARSACPDFLFNHCLRTYLLGALSLEAQRLDFDAELAFTAAALHDLGLLPAFATPHGSFEIDGANRAEALLREAGRPARQGRLVWNAIVTHDIRAEYAAHQSHEAQLVAAGAGADVVDPGGLDHQAVDEIVSAFPRLQFKTRFTTLLVDHCRRKPTVQMGWLDGLCRMTSPDAARGDVPRAIAQAPYSE